MKYFYVSVLCLSQGGADLHTTGPDGQTALHIACHRAKLETVEALLELGMSISIMSVSKDVGVRYDHQLHVSE